jgi:hypothetical protein
MTTMRSFKTKLKNLRVKLNCTDQFTREAKDLEINHNGTKIVTLIDLKTF